LFLFALSMINAPFDREFYPRLRKKSSEDAVVPAVRITPGAWIVSISMTRPRVNPFLYNKGGGRKRSCVGPSPFTGNGLTDPAPGLQTIYNWCEGSLEEHNQA
jgi:hypothetical protein